MAYAITTSQLDPCPKSRTTNNRYSICDVTQVRPTDPYIVGSTWTSWEFTVRYPISIKLAVDLL